MQVKRSVDNWQRGLRWDCKTMDEEDRQLSPVEWLYILAMNTGIFLFSAHSDPAMWVIFFAVLPVFLLMIFFGEKLSRIHVKIWLVVGNVIVTLTILVGFWFLMPALRYEVGANAFSFFLFFIIYIGYLRGRARE
jgi:membrane protein YdbS with pleckstrin-like domain